MRRENLGCQMSGSSMISSVAIFMMPIVIARNVHVYTNTSTISYQIRFMIIDYYRWRESTFSVNVRTAALSRIW